MWKISCDLSLRHSVDFLEWCSINGLSDGWGGNLVLWGRLLKCGERYKCQHDDFILSVMENGNGGRCAWCCSGSRVPKVEIVYLCQVLLILSIVLASINNLTNQQGDQQLWVALLSSCMGYLLPNPSIKSWVTSISRCRVIPPWIITRPTRWQFYHPTSQHHRSDGGLGGRVSGNPVLPQLVQRACRRVLSHIQGALSVSW